MNIKPIVVLLVLTQSVAHLSAYSGGSFVVCCDLSGLLVELVISFSQPVDVRDD